jgi:pimeloyl-ACP methyl ester carboxylesterase
MKLLIALAAVSFLLLAAAPALQEEPAFNVAEAGLEGENASASMDMAAMLEDPDRDSAHPARNRQLLVPSHGVGLNALFLLAAGDKPKPTMLLLHGLPGNEQNLDLAQAVRRKGWNVLTLHYRGSWGSPGTFSIANAIEDAEAAMALIRSDAAAAEYRIDRRRLVIAGHSMGGLAAALYAAGADPRPLPDGVFPTEADRRAFEEREAGTARAPGAKILSGVLLIDAWNPGSDAARLAAGGPAELARFEAGLDDLGNSLAGATSASLAREVRDNGAAWDLRGRAAALGRHKIFILYAKHGLREGNIALADSVARACPEPLEAGCGSRLWYREFDTDHAFADKRLELARWVTMWLDTLDPYKPLMDGTVPPMVGPESQVPLSLDARTN